MKDFHVLSPPGIQAHTPPKTSMCSSTWKLSESPCSRVFTETSLNSYILIKLLTTWLNSVSSSPFVLRVWEMGLKVPTLLCVWQALLLKLSVGPPWVTLLAQPHCQNRLIMSNKKHFDQSGNSKGFWSYMHTTRQILTYILCHTTHGNGISTIS